MKNQFRVAVITTFAIGVLALGLAQGFTLLLPNTELPYSFSLMVEYLLAGGTLAVCSLPPFRNALALQANPRALVQRTFFSATAAYVLFLALTLWTAPGFSFRWLVSFYAFEIFLVWFAWRFLLRTNPPQPSSRALRIATYFDETPHAPFVIAGLFLLIMTPAFLMACQDVAASRSANWAFGFLVVGVGIAFINYVALPSRLRQALGQFPQTLVFILPVLSLALVFALSVGDHTKPELIYLVDVYPNNIAGSIRAEDVIISDSPSLRLHTIPDISSYLDLRPDDRGVALWDDLIGGLKNKAHVYWVSVPNDSRDTQQVLSTFLKSNGCLTALPGSPLPVRTYELRAPLTYPRVLPPLLVSRTNEVFDPAEVDFGSIRMLGFRFEPAVCSHDAVAVAIRWQLAQPSRDPLKVSLFLTDAKDRLIQAQDFFIDDLSEKHTSEWSSNGTAATYHLLVVPFGTPPGNYSLSAAVYPASNPQRLGIVSAMGVAKGYADFVTLGRVQVYRPDDLTADPYHTIKESDMAPAQVIMREGLMLDSYSVANREVSPGEDLAIAARWRSLFDSLPAYNALVRVQHDGALIAQASSAPVDGTYPTGRWRAGESVMDRWNLRIPPDTPGGMARLEIGLEGGKSLYIADISIASIPHTVQIPQIRYTERAALASVAELMGYNLEQTQVSPGDRVNLTLYWRAMALPPIAKNYKVFVQLLATDGHLIAQSDRVPANGARPTRGWVNGEIISDSHELEFKDTNYRGDAELIVGIYDPATLDRMPLTDNSKDFIKLRVPIHVTSR